jgi:rare lipoprotein A
VCGRNSADANWQPRFHRTRRSESAARWGLLLLLCVSACAVVRSPAVTPSTIEVPQPAAENPVYVETGVASWYGAIGQGGMTASGEAYDPNAMTAAHRSLPFGTIIRITNLANRRMVKVRVNDRGPFIAGRMLDLSAAAAAKLGIKQDGMDQVRLEEYASDQH